jgi:hypothetical protein
MRKEFRPKPIVGCYHKRGRNVSCQREGLGLTSCPSVRPTAAMVAVATTVSTLMLASAGYVTPLLPVHMMILLGGSVMTGLLANRAASPTASGGSVLEYATRGYRYLIMQEMSSRSIPENRPHARELASATTLGRSNLNLVNGG